MTEQLKTGTTTLGILCKDGVVIAADRRMTAGNLISLKEGIEKVIPINNQAVLTIAGGVADAVLFIKLIKAETRLNKLRLGRENTPREMASLIGNIVYNNIRSQGSVTHFLLAAKGKDGFELFDIFPDGTVTKIPRFISTGSGSYFAEGVLETLYKKDTAVAEALDIAKKALHASMTKDTATGNGVDIYKLTKNGVEKVETITLSASILSQ
ncbi:MAG TPA: proteasome subunit beta [Acidobacteriota bacterium]|nr:proteasome subunit beta [Acidobacteriota bacterium]